MSDNNVELKGLEQWLYLIKRFGMSPKEALDTMQNHEQDVASVLVYLEEILESFTLNIKEDYECKHLMNPETCISCEQENREEE